MVSFKNVKMFVVFLVFSVFLSPISCSLRCYSCVSSEPGCDEFYVDRRIHSAITCPRHDDKCIKLIERRGVDKFIIRDCLSNLEAQRRDIPADRYDGCRKAAEQPKLDVYVEYHIPQLEIKQQHYDDVTYCFCEFDRCNDDLSLSSNILFVFQYSIYIINFFQYCFIADFFF